MQKGGGKGEDEILNKMEVSYIKKKKEGVPTMGP
jgi:hypothetical protein